MLLYKGYVYISHTCVAVQMASQIIGIQEYAAKALKITLCIWKQNQILQKTVVNNAYISVFLYISLFCKIHISVEIENAFN